MSEHCEFDFEELDNDELRIDEKRTGLSGEIQRYNIVIKKAWIPWIITALRNFTVDDYNTRDKYAKNEYEDCNLVLEIRLSEESYSHAEILPIWKDAKRAVTPAIQIPYLSRNKTKLMSEFIEPFLVELSQFLTEEESGKLPPPWSEIEKKENSQSDTKAFLKLVDAMFITGRRGDAEISDTFEFHFEEAEGEMPKYPIPLNFILRNRTTTKYGFSKK